MKTKLFAIIIMVLMTMTSNIVMAQTPGKRIEKHYNNQNKKQVNSINVKRTSYSKSGDDFMFNVRGVVFKMKYVEGGTFTMGATREQGNEAYPEEKPTHIVTLSSYSIGETEVTQALWRAVMGENPSYFKGDDLPVESVSWDYCQEFIRKLNSMTGRNFRLPTEAEWEYAARGGNKSCGYKYSGSSSIGDVAWYAENSEIETYPVGTKHPNELGIYDMSGNVWEWCSDWYGRYGSGSQSNPTGSISGDDRVNRGGGYNESARHCRVSSRDFSAPDDHYVFLGLRLVLPQ